MVLPARIVLIVIIVGVLALARPAASDTVFFDVGLESAQPATLSAELSAPEGTGRFPAVVMLHGCNGLWRPWGDLWAERLVRWGYVAFQVDSFGPRGYPDGICSSFAALPPSSGALLPWKRAADAHAAKDYLKGLPIVDKDRIAVMGMSHGGSATMSAVENTYFVKATRPDPFKAAIALYPGCDQQLYRLDAPLLILIGEADDWTFAFKCERMALVGPTDHTITLKVYPGATHAFDVNRPDREYLGHTIKFRPSAA